MLINGIIRSFNPIGQGAFVTEHFYRNGKEYATVIFDAGFLKTATKGGEKRAKRVVQSVLAKEVPISAIFISHLDEDHVGLVPYILREYHDQVKHIVLPRFSQEVVFAYYFWYKINYINRAKGKINWSRNLAQLITEIARKLGYVRGDEGRPLNQERGPNWYFIRSDEDERQPSFRVDNRDLIDLDSGGLGRIADEPSGIVFDLAVQSCQWHFVPYHRDDLRGKHKAKRFWEQIIDKYKDCFKHESYSPDQPFFSGDHAALEKLAELSKCVLRKKGGYKELARIYKSAWGDRNVDSMVVVSFPSSDCSVLPCRPIDFWSFLSHLIGSKYNHPSLMSILKPGAIYTGDSNAAELPSQILLGSSSISKNIGSVQVPHHGSASSWDGKLATGDATLYFASYGSVNTYGHPAPNVVRDIVLNFKIPLFYNEYSMPYMQVYSFE